ncbi:DUF3224 domain-containing protein [Streptomyces sp. NPDC090025]|uniref:DUF3224 domain-containing protein n=1 Tax=Streptomyces sp. NPDC090025 TaxID=3365922 RepID=UPI003836CD63
MNGTMLRGAAVTASALTAFGFAAAPGGAAEPALLSHYYDSGTEIVPTPGTACGPGGDAISGRATFGTRAGDVWRGTTAYTYCLYPEATPGRYRYVGVETLTGSAGACGRGTFTWIGRGSTTEGGTWHIAVGSGTGDLTRARGSGTNTATTSPTWENYGTFSGVFSC